MSIRLHDYTGSGGGSSGSSITVNGKPGPSIVLTSSDFGLDNVSNYSIATTLESQNGAVDNKYMTPLKTSQAITYQVGTTLTNHIANTSNPHSVTKTQIGLGNVDNTADLDKPISTLTQTALTNLDNKFVNYVLKTSLGVADGVATLDSTGHVTSSQLPSYIVSGLKWQGAWDASTNTPAIPAATSLNDGYFYKVSVAGTSSITGTSVSYHVGDWLISNGTTWEYVANNIDAATNTTLGTVQLAGDIGGTAASPKVVGLNGVAASSTAPTAARQFLMSNNTTALKYDVLTAADLPSATLTTEGSIKLAKDLGGTSALPLVVGINGITAPSTAPTAARQILMSSSTTALKYDVLAADDLPDATTSTKGIVQLTSDLGGTAAAPLLKNINGISIPASNPTATRQFMMSSGTTALQYDILKDTDIPDATTTSKGGVYLANDLGGTASAPTVVGINGYAINNTPSKVNQVLGISNLTTKKLEWMDQSGTGSSTSTADEISWIQIQGTVSTSVSAAGVVVPLNSSLMSSEGTDITFASATNSFLLKGGNTYELYADISVVYDASATDYLANIQWRTGTVGGSGTLLGIFGSPRSVSAAVGNSVGSGIATAIYTPATDTYVHVEVTRDAGVAQVNHSSSFPSNVMITKLGGGGGGIAYIDVAASTPQTTNVSAGNNVIFATTRSSAGNQITLNSTTGILTLKAGYTYELVAGIPMMTYTTGSAIISFSWYNITAGTYIGSATINRSSISSNVNPPTSSPIMATVVATVDTQVALRILTNTNIATLGADSDVGAFNTSGYPWAKVVVMSSGGAAITDASTTTKGMIQIGGDLAGSSTSQQVIGIDGYAITNDPTNLSDVLSVTDLVNKKLTWQAPTSSSSGVTPSSFVKVYTTANQTITQYATVVFGTIEASAGSQISYSTSTNSFLLKAGNTYELTSSFGEVSVASATGWTTRWRTGNVAGSGTWLGQLGEVIATTYASNANSLSNPHAIYTPASDTYVHLEQYGTVGAIIAGGSYPSYAMVKMISGSLAASGQSVEYGIVRYTGADTGSLVTGGTVGFDSTASGNATYSSSMFTLKANITYELEAFLGVYNTTAASGGRFQFYNFTDSAYIGNVSVFSSQSAAEGSNANSNGPMVHVITPTKNIQVGVKMISYYGQAPGIIGSAAIATGGAAGSTYFYVKQLGTSTVTTAIGASSSADGVGGIVPASVAGEQDKSYCGDAKYHHRGSPFDVTVAYKAGDRCYYSFRHIEANADIPANTAFTWGTTGATWKPVLDSEKTWKGVFTTGVAYNVADIVAATATGAQIFRCVTAIASSTTDYDTLNGIYRNYWRSIQGGIGLDFANASSTSNGYAGLVPTPLIGEQEKVLTAGSNWAHRYSPYALTTAYNAGDRVVKDGVLIEAVAAIAASTVFAWGDTGAVWKPVLDSTKTWRGVYASTNTYALLDVCAAATTGVLYQCVTAITTASANYLPTTGSGRNRWRPFAQDVYQDMLASTSSLAGQAGSVVAPAAGDQERLYTGSATWLHRAAPYTLTLAYRAGDRVIKEGILIEALGTIAASTAFAWGTTGATWKPVVSSTETWGGIFSSSTTYTVGTIVAATTTNTQLYVCVTAITTAGAAYEPTAGASRNYWKPVLANNALDAVPSTLVLPGQSGLVPAATIAQYGAVYTGGGFKILHCARLQHNTLVSIGTSYTKVTGLTATLDTASAWSSANQNYTAPTAGIYTVSGELQFANGVYPTTGQISLAVYVDGTFVQSGNVVIQNTSVSDYFSVILPTVVLSLNASQVITFYALCGPGTRNTNPDTGTSHISIVQIR